MAQFQGLVPEHECTVEFISAEVRVSSTGRGYIIAKLKLADGPHEGRELFYAYCPARGVAEDIAKAQGLPTTEEDLPHIGGRRIRARIKHRPHNGGVYATVDLRGRPL